MYYIIDVKRCVVLSNRQCKYLFFERQEMWMSKCEGGLDDCISSRQTHKYYGGMRVRNIRVDK